MRSALHSWSFQKRFAADPSFTARDVIAIAADLGFSGVELLTGQAGGGTGHLRTEEPREVAALVRFAESRGVRVDCFSTYNDFAFTPNEEWRLANIAYIQRWLALAGDCGVPNIRMLTGYWVRGRSQVALQRLVLDGVRDCVAHAERAGVNMALENHSSVFLEAEDILWLIGEIGSARLTTCPDPTNWSRAFLEDKADRAERDYLFRSVELVAPRMTQSHLKILGIAEDGTLAGFGPELDRLLRIYRDAGYAGALAFEHIGPADPLAELPRAKAIVDAAIARIASTSGAHA
jgi:sugar phosphate isomerase/epimerase